MTDLPTLRAAVMSAARVTDLALDNAPAMTIGFTTVTPVGVRLNYLVDDDGSETVMVRVDGRGKNGHLNYYNLHAEESWPEWLAALVKEHRPVNRTAVLTEAADLIAHWHGAAPDVFSPQDSAALLRHVATGGNPGATDYELRPTFPDRPCGCSARFERHADGCGAVLPPCNCGHDRAQHDAGQCRVCPGDSENTWQHPYTAASR